jgi:hypothetical protein
MRTIDIPKALILTLAAFGLSSCASMMAEHRATVCQDAYAYEAGLNDGRVEKPASSARFGQTCGLVRGESLAATYQRGYQDGLNQSYRDRELEARRDRELNDNGGIRIDLGDSRLRVDYPPFGGRRTAMRNKRQFFCEVKVFNRRYSSFGATQVEAREKLLKQCAASEKSDFFCKKADCQKNI